MEAQPDRRGPIAIAGTGRVAQAIGRLLRGKGEPVACVAGRDAARTARAAEFIGAEAVTFPALAGRASLVLIAVSDGALGEVAARLAGAIPAGGIALHTCGAAGPEAIGALREAGVYCGVLHPLQTVSEPLRGAASLRGAGFAISGDAPAVRWAEEIVALCDGVPLRIRPEARALYHAAAVMASNYVVALLGAAESLMAAAAEPGQPALAALAPLVRATVDNVFRSGPVGALTGPIERGDFRTVAAHMEALAAVEPRIRELYRAAGAQALEIARGKGLPPYAAARIEEILRGTESV